MKTASLLRVARERSGLTLRELQAVTGISTGRLSMLERDMVRPKLEDEQRLAAALRTSADEIFPVGPANAASAGQHDEGTRPSLDDPAAAERRPLERRVPSRV